MLALTEVEVVALQSLRTIPGVQLLLTRRWLAEQCLAWDLPGASTVRALSLAHSPRIDYRPALLDLEHPDRFIIPVFKLPRTLS